MDFLGSDIFRWVLSRGGSEFVYAVVYGEMGSIASWKFGLVRAQAVESGATARSSADKLLFRSKILAMFHYRC